MDFERHLARVHSRAAELEAMLQDPQVLAEPTRLAQLNREYGELQEAVSLAGDLSHLKQEIQHLEASIKSEPVGELRQMAETELEAVRGKLVSCEADLIELLEPSDPLDGKNTIIEIRAGTGGDEASLFAADLYRMYMRYAERMGWRVQVLSESRQDLGGYREIIFEVKGKRVYSHLKYESGVHRVQRIPTTEKGGRIHTSTASVAVLPEAEEVDIEIKSDDLKIEATTSSGHGGQSVNTTYSAIRIVHLPTGLTVICQDERSQKQNREKALTVLRSRLLSQRREQQHQARDSARRSQIGTADRSEKIRTYNFPQDRLTDHRLKQNWHNLPGILDGTLAEVISALRQSEHDSK